MTTKGKRTLVAATRLPVWQSVLRCLGALFVFVAAIVLLITIIQSAQGGVIDAYTIAGIAVGATAIRAAFVLIRRYRLGIVFVTYLAVPLVPFVGAYGVFLGLGLVGAFWFALIGVLLSILTLVLDMVRKPQSVWAWQTPDW